MTNFEILQFFNLMTLNIFKSLTLLIHRNVINKNVINGKKILLSSIGIITMQ